MTSRNITRNVGFEDTHIDVGEGLDFKASVDATTKAEDKVDATGDARAIAGTEAQVAVLDTTIAVGKDAALAAIETGTVKASAETTSGDARAEASNMGPTGGFIDSRRRFGLTPDSPVSHDSKADISIGNSGVITATLTNAAAADATAVGGRADAAADTGRVAGFRNVGITAGEGSSLTSSVAGTMAATASAVGASSHGASGDAFADAGSDDSSLVGIEAEHRAGDMAIAFGRTAVIRSDVTGDMGAKATTVTGRSDADTRADLVAGIAMGAGRHGLASEAPVAASPTAAPADTTAAAPAAASAPSTDSPDHGKPSDALLISLGEGGALRATAQLTADATAETVTGPVQARVGIDTIAGIVDRRLLEEHHGGHGVVDGSAAAPVADSGSSTDAPSPAPTPANLDHDHSQGSVLTIGKGGSVTAFAIGDSLADASGVTAPDGEHHDDKAPEGSGASGDVLAEVNHDNVVGIAIDKLAIGETGTLYSGAQSKQLANAKVVSAGVDPTARVAHGDRVIGILDTQISTGGDLLVKPAPTAALPTEKFDVEAYLTGTSTASAVSGLHGTRAEAGEDSSVVGIREGKLAVGGNIGTGDGTFKVLASSDLGAQASATTGRVEAQAGSHDSEVVGLQSLPITIGQSGSIRTGAVGTVVSDASTTTGDAEARSTQTARGLEDTRIHIGDNGSVTSSADLVGRATAATTSGDADASVKLTSEGIDQRTRLISIGKEGDVSGKALADGDATAAAVTGRVEAGSSIDAHGINLERRSAISIGEYGSVSGSADAGTAKVEATNTNGRAEAHGNYDVAGILGESGATITAGPEGVRTKPLDPARSDIKGSASGKGLLLASTTTGRADASTHADLLGISHTDLTAGLKGANLISAKADGDYTTTSTTVTGDADADGHVSVGALIGNAWGPPHTATLSGDLNAVANLRNQVEAHSVTGSATAHASGDAVGISGYAIHILGSGIISAQVSSNTITSASTVTV